MKKGSQILVAFSLFLLGLPIVFFTFISWKYKKPSEGSVAKFEKTSTCLQNTVVV
ncbi:hypothetical protein LW858_29435 (plasmid) [Bacillus cereus]|uniref:hypothetical protein n=1 Tax=Bacillus cereus TaxID=1396 RepID=UPI001F206572|nr:hypothetical protein [Bacillus cereus]UIJ69699.1 hypothetical protein LW858_29435 [Bacillus cereus]